MSDPLEIISSTAHAIHRLGQLTEEQFARSAGGLGITARQVVVLAIADQLEGASQTKLCEISGIDRSTLADMVRRLVQRGLLDRQRTREDARRNAVRITSEGRNLLERVLPIAHQVDRELLQGLSPSERETFTVLLHKVLSNAPTGDAIAQNLSKHCRQRSAHRRRDVCAEHHTKKAEEPA